MSEGWVCPVCRRCYSPCMVECPHCPPKIETSGSSVPLKQYKEPERNTATPMPKGVDVVCSGKDEK